MRATLLLVTTLFGGCADRTIARVPVEQGKVETRDVPAVARRDIDILFLIDDSGSMKEEQDSLRANFNRFISVLDSIDGGLPNIHIGVTTPDLGTSATDGTTAGNLGGCNGKGKAGALRTLPGTPLKFLSDVADATGGRTRNYTGTLTDRFAELADVGTTGCGIEQHLEAIKRALDNNPENPGFLRPNAYLAVIIIADEDDCSLAQSSLFAGNTNDPAWGDKVNFKCTHEGIECDSPATDLSIQGRREDCHPKYDTTQLTQIERYVAFLKSLKANPKDVVVAGIIGDAGPFEIGDKNGVSILKPSCQYDGPTGTQYAYPAIRTRDFLQQFFDRNAATTICDGDLSDGLTQIGALLKDVVQNPCFRYQLADADPDQAGTQYDCAVSQVRKTANLPDEELGAMPACDPTRSRVPCWHIEEDAVQCAFTQTDPHLKLVIERGGVVPTPDLYVRASCVTAAPIL